MRVLLGLVLAIGSLITATVAAQGPIELSSDVLSVQEAVVTAIERCERSIVAIRGTRAPDAARLVTPPDPFAPFKPTDVGGVFAEALQGEFGTGVILDAGGLILTHFEVIRGMDSLEVTTADRRTYPAQIVGADERSGLAVLSIQASGLPAIILGDAKQLRKGEFVVALGNPYGIAADGQASASFGIVANVGRKSTIAPRGEAASLGELGWLLQTDARLNLGTSGGALVNLRGQLVGLATSVAATAGYDQAAGYAIPVDDAFRRIVQTLRQGREVEYGLLGVFLDNMGDRPGVLGRDPRGALVREVMPGGPADRAGVRAGDVLTHVGDTPVYNSDGLMLAISQQPPLATAQIHFLRNGREQTVRVELSKTRPHGEQIVTARAKSWRGLRVDFATAVEAFTTAVREGAIDPGGCVAVRHVEPHTAAWNAGLRPGSFISHIDDNPVRAPEDFYSLAEERSGDVILHLSGPQDQPQQVTVKGRS